MVGITIAFTPLASHQVSPNSSFSLIHHLDAVNCRGNESNLNECEHEGIGVHNCYVRLEEAGVVCECKFLFVASTSDK